MTKSASTRAVDAPVNSSPGSFSLHYLTGRQSNSFSRTFLILRSIPLASGRPNEDLPGLLPPQRSPGSHTREHHCFQLRLRQDMVCLNLADPSVLELPLTRLLSMEPTSNLTVSTHWRLQQLCAQKSFSVKKLSKISSTIYGAVRSSFGTVSTYMQRKCHMF